MENCNNECRFYTVKDIQKLMGIGKNKAYEYVEKVYKDQSPFPVIMVGSTYRIPKAKYDEFSNSGKSVTSNN